MVKHKITITLLSYIAVVVVFVAGAATVAVVATFKRCGHIKVINDRSNVL